MTGRSARMDDRADVRHRQEIRQMILAGFEVHLDFGEARDVENVGRRADTIRAATSPAPPTLALKPS
jgi:hypothetical protein